MQRDRRTGDLRPSKPLLPAQTPPALRAAARAAASAVAEAASGNASTHAAAPQPDAEIHQAAEDAPVAPEAAAGCPEAAQCQSGGRSDRSQPQQNGLVLASPVAAPQVPASLMPSMMQPLIRVPGNPQRPSQSQAGGQPGSPPQRTQPQAAHSQQRCSQTEGGSQTRGSSRQDSQTSHRSQQQRSQTHGCSQHSSQPPASPSVIDLAGDSDSDEEVAVPGTAEAQVTQLPPSSPCLTPPAPTAAAAAPAADAVADAAAAQKQSLQPVAAADGAQPKAAPGAAGVPAPEVGPAAKCEPRHPLATSVAAQGSQAAAGAGAQGMTASAGRDSGDAAFAAAADAAAADAAAVAVAEEAQAPGIWFEV